MMEIAEVAEASDTPSQRFGAPGPVELVPISEFHPERSECIPWKPLHPWKTLSLI